MWPCTVEDLREQGNRGRGLGWAGLGCSVGWILTLRPLSVDVYIRVSFLVWRVVEDLHVLHRDLDLAEAMY